MSNHVHDIASGELRAALPDTQPTALSANEQGVIRRVLKSETYLIKEHLVRLDHEARRRRFNHDVSDEFIAKYVAGAAELGSLTFGCFFDGDIRAIAELRLVSSNDNATAEVAFSVEDAFAGRGIATRLMNHVIRAARNRGIRHLILVCLAENKKMQAIVRRYGAELHVDDDSIVADIVPKGPDCLSITAEMIDDRMIFVHAVLDLQQRLARRVQ